ncbi:M56 family metallopeptidase [Pedobacter psychroterrae]|uniref:M56 family peptidase n=1 Tax=Pedobacter psychroterrae TaxID=2530453 RepID=A0A4R0NDE1_9SPHI|nr:M56 family metallopeptidase [Pedobacter psychroterrae]TCC98295.1 M56 family peptidase [Pedobacter psychroterrae]
MEEFGLYLLKSALCSTLFFGVYWFFFRNETFYRFNRFFMLTGLFCSLILPLYTYTYEVIIPVTNVPANNTGGGLENAKESSNAWIYGLMGAYGLGVCILLLRHFVGLLKIKKVISRTGYSSGDGYRLVQADDFKSSFSFFNYIILDGSDELSATERKLVMEHERAHVKQQHWADLLLAQVVCALQWFNPVAWLYLQAIRQNHEFLADEAVLQQGNSPAIYRAVLVNHCVGTRVFSFSSSFYQYQLSRIKMLAKPASGPVKKIAVLAVLPALAVFLWAFAKPEFTVQQQLVKSSVRVQKEQGKEKPLYLLDGVEIPPVMEDVDQNNIESIHVLKDGQAIAAYGERGRNGVILIYTKKPKVKPELLPTSVR